MHDSLKSHDAEDRGFPWKKKKERKGRSFKLYEGEEYYWWPPRDTSNNDNIEKGKHLWILLIYVTLLLIRIFIIGVFLIYVSSAHLPHLSNFNKTNTNIINVLKFLKGSLCVFLLVCIKFIVPCNRDSCICNAITRLILFLQFYFSKIQEWKIQNADN